MKVVRYVFTLVLSACSLFSQQIDVTTLSDSGVGSLREGLTLAQDNDILLFDTGLSGTLTLLSSLPSTNVSIQIIGPPSGLVTISGDSSFQAFQVNTGEVQISDLHVGLGHSASSGAGLYIGDGAKVTFTRGSFNNCVAVGSEGGAVHVGSDAVFIATDTTFSGNSSGGSGADVFMGAGSTFSYSISGTVGAIEVFGSGSLFKGGSGSATFSIPSSTPILLVAAQGTTIVAGITTEPTIIYSGVRVEGPFETLYMANHGIFKPSQTIGTSTITQDYYQQELGTLEIGLTPSTTDLLAVGGHAYLQGALLLNPSAGSYTVDTIYTILTTGGGVNQEFTSVTSTDPNIGFQVTYFPQRIDVQITSTP